MHGIYDLKESLCRELEEYGQKNKFELGDLDIVDKLAHATKNLDKIIKSYEEQEYSYRSYDGGNYSYPRNNYYSRGERRSYGRNRGYSMNNGMIEDLRSLMMDAPDDRTRQKFQKLIDELEQM